MSETQNSSIPVWFWVISAIALVWNLMGVFAYIQQVTLTPEALAAMTTAQQDLYNATPAWVNGAFAFSVFGGAIGCLLLLLKKSLAKIAFIISFVGVVTQMSYAFSVVDSMDSFGPGGVIMPIMIIIIAVLLIWLASSAKKKGWII